MPATITADCALIRNGRDWAPDDVIMLRQAQLLRQDTPRNEWRLTVGRMASKSSLVQTWIAELSDVTQARWNTFQLQFAGGSVPTLVEVENAILCQVGVSAVVTGFLQCSENLEFLCQVRTQVSAAETRDSRAAPVASGILPINGIAPDATGDFRWAEPPFPPLPAKTTSIPTVWPVRSRRHVLRG